MKAPTIKDFTMALRSVVRCMPKDLEKECRRINTFGWLMSMSQLNATNAEASIKKYRKGEYYVRSYEQSGQMDKIVTDYPAAVVDNVYSEIQNLCTPSFQIYTIVLSVWDLYYEAGQKEGCTACEDRTAKEIECDTEWMLQFALNEVVNMIQISNGERTIWVGEQFFYSEDNTCFARPEWKQVCSLKPNIMGGAKITREYSGKDNLIGATATINVKLARQCTNTIKVNYCDCEECEVC